MAKILCVLDDDPTPGYPPTYARSDISKIAAYPGGQTVPNPEHIDFTPGESLGCVSGALGLRKYVESLGHTGAKSYGVGSTHSKEAATLVSA
jgi:formate dehydrogenase